MGGTSSTQRSSASYEPKEEEGFTVGSFSQKELIGLGLGALAGFLVSRQTKADERTRWLTILAGGGAGYLLSGLNTDHMTIFGRSYDVIIGDQIRNEEDNS